jgi:hypothetical protein
MALGLVLDTTTTTTTTTTITTTTTTMSTQRSPSLQATTQTCAPLRGGSAAGVMTSPPRQPCCPPSLTRSLSLRHTSRACATGGWRLCNRSKADKFLTLCQLQMMGGRSGACATVNGGDAGVAADLGQTLHCALCQGLLLDTCSPSLISLRT